MGCLGTIQGSLVIRGSLRGPRRDLAIGLASFSRKDGIVNRLGIGTKSKGLGWSNVHNKNVLVEL